MTALDPWNIAILATKWLGYCATAAAIGGAFGLLILFRRTAFYRRVSNYVLASCLLGLVVATGNFFVQAGAFAEAGWAGMFDGFYLQFLWQTGSRTALILKLLGFALLAAGIWSCNRSSTRGNTALPPTATVVLLLGGVLLAASFQAIGHTAEATGVARAAVFLHVIGMSLWIGNLYPLRLSCRFSPLPELKTIMERFSALAMIVVGVLLACGIFLVLALLGSVAALLTSSYGLGLLAKLALVGGLLAIAALNKWFWVPRLAADSRHATGLARAIELELFFALFILAITAVMTTLTGPER